MAWHFNTVQAAIVRMFDRCRERCHRKHQSNSSIRTPHCEAKQAFRRLRGKELHLLRLRFESKCPYTRIAIIIIIINNIINTI